jgi:hypothetical protein
MKCQRCQEHDAVERDGAPVRLNVFEEWEGFFCQECVLALQEPYNADLRQRISDRAPALTDEALARFPDQMLKFTLTFPVHAPRT